MKSRYRQLEEEIDNIRYQISQLPEGDFYCTRNGKRYKWYQSFNNKKPAKYISKSERDFAEKLVFKKYLILQIEELIREKNAIESYLKKYTKRDSKFDEFMSHSEYQRLLAPNLNKKTLEFIKWMQEPYKKNNSHPEHLIHKTITGELVRSKSESLIYMYLKMNNIPFRYECVLKLGEATYYPDFTILHPKSGEVYYWENFGRMDDSAYIQRNFLKMQVYTLYGIVPGKKLITTFETANEPLDVEEVQELVKRYFL